MVGRVNLRGTTGAAGIFPDPVGGRKKYGMVSDPPIRDGNRKEEIECHT